MHPSIDSLEARRQFLTAGLFRSLSEGVAGETDYFTASEQYPKAFRVGKCDLKNAGSADVQVLLFWRNDERNEQKELAVSTIRKEGAWLIDKVSN
jgi:hypothetical protein